MARKASLPYAYLDLFPHAQTPREMATPGSISGASFTENLRSVGHLMPLRAADNSNRYKTFFRRLLKPRTLDFETAIWEVFHLIVNPRKMYRANYTYKHSGRLLYARDDPLFLILVTGFLCLSAVAWGLAYLPNFPDILRLIFTMVVFDFYVSGLVVSTVLWVLSNKLFNPDFSFTSLYLQSTRYNVNYIDWGFCFDVHCNSFLIIWCLLYLVQFFLLPVLTIKESFLSMLLGNTLYFGAIGHYFVVTFYGFNSLPFVGSAYYSRLLGPNPAKTLQVAILVGILPVLAVGWVLCVLFRFNVSYHMVHNYFN